MNRSSIALGVLIGCAVLAGSVSAASVVNPEQNRRSDLVVQIVEKWGAHADEVQGQSPDAWQRDMVPVLNGLSIDGLQRVANARNFDDMNVALAAARKAPKVSLAPIAPHRPGLVSGSNRRLSSSGGEDAVQNLGDPSTDLVYVPVLPCRILDTRVAGGVMAAGETREFDVTSTSDYSPQGGSPTNCNGVGAAGAFAAANISFTAVLPAGPGFLTAYPVGTSRPLATILDFNGSELATVQSTVRLSQSSPSTEFALYSHNQTHVVADIVGYFIAPQATALECIETFATENVAANGVFDFEVPSCPASYALTGAGCRTPNFDNVTWAINGLYRNAPGVMLAFCSGTNNSAGVIAVEGAAQCCRVPGR